MTIDNQSDKPICKITTVEGKDDVAKFDTKTPADCIGAGGDSLVVVGQPHGDTLFAPGGDDGPNWLFQRQGNTMRITYVDFAEDDGCMQTQFACTAGH